MPGAELVSVVLCDERGSFLTSSVGYSVRLDKRNDPIMPTRGYYLDLSQDVAGFGGNVHYVRTEWDAGWYHGFNKDFILSLTTPRRLHQRLGRRHGAGSTTASTRAATPSSASSSPASARATLSFGDALGGKLYLIGEIQQTFPNFLPAQYGIKTALISDIGTLGLLDKVEQGRSR